MEENQENKEFEIDNSEYEIVETPKQDNVEHDPKERIALYSFILACIATATLAESWFLSIGTIIMASISRKLYFEAKDVSTQPYKTFMKIVKYASIALIILGIVATAGYLIRDILKAINNK